MYISKVCQLFSLYLSGGDVNDDLMYVCVFASVNIFKMASIFVWMYEKYIYFMIDLRVFRLCMMP